MTLNHPPQIRRGPLDAGGRLLLFEYPVEASNGAMWVARANQLILAMWEPLLHLQRIHDCRFDAAVLLHWLKLPNLESLAWDNEGGGLQRHTVRLRHYLEMLPGYTKSKSGQQDATTVQMHDYTALQLRHDLEKW